MRVLLGDIAGGALPPGTDLPRETDLAQQFGVSRGVARECVRGLEERGLVAVKHGRGARVRPEADWDVLHPDVLAALLAGEHGVRLLGEYLECRRVLEIEAAALAAERAGSHDIEALADALERMRASAGRTPGNEAAEALYHAADIDFHRAVIAATGNRALGRMTEPVHRALSAARRPLARPLARQRVGIPEHQRILGAIAAADEPGARAAMAAHLETVERYLGEYAAQVVGARSSGERDA